jgi:hypothetical protein
VPFFSVKSSVFSTADSSQNVALSVVIPCFNGEATIGSLIKRYRVRWYAEAISQGRSRRVPRYFSNSRRYTQNEPCRRAQFVWALALRMGRLQGSLNQGLALQSDAGAVEFRRQRNNFRSAQSHA